MVAEYKFDRFKTGQKAHQKVSLKKLTLQLKNDTDFKKEIPLIEAMTDGMNLSRDLVNLPPNYANPDYMAKTAKELAKEGLKVQVLGEKEMTKLGMNCLLAVGRASEQESRLIVMKYTGNKKSKDYKAIVGKGVMFDSGGYNLKPSQGMDEMKYDMCGGASVFGALSAVAELDLPLNVIGIVPSSENLPDGAANKPGDIVTSMSGKTIEILNTDAEGRLILCDALTYAERYKPDAIVDIATLTGACVIALGHPASGVFSNDDTLADQLLDAGEQTRDRAWRLPLWDEYHEQLKSGFADMANVGGRGAGAVTAACFLSRFAEKMKWAHMDIAGSAWKTNTKTGATGRPVPLLTQFLINRSTN